MKKIVIAILFVLIAQMGFSQKDSLIPSKIIFSIGSSTYSSTQTSGLGLNLAAGYRWKNNIIQVDKQSLTQSRGIFPDNPYENFDNWSLMYGKFFPIGKSKLYAMGGVGRMTGNKHGGEITESLITLNSVSWFSGRPWSFSKRYENITISTISFPFEVGTYIYCSKNIDIGLNAYAIFSKQENLKGISLKFILKANPNSLK